MKGNQIILSFFLGSGVIGSGWESQPNCTVKGRSNVDIETEFWKILPVNPRQLHGLWSELLRDPDIQHETNQLIFFTSRVDDLVSDGHNNTNSISYRIVTQKKLKSHFTLPSNILVILHPSLKNLSCIQRCQRHELQLFKYRTRLVIAGKCSITSLFERDDDGVFALCSCRRW